MRHSVIGDVQNTDSKLFYQNRPHSSLFSQTVCTRFRFNAALNCFAHTPHAFKWAPTRIRIHECRLELWLNIAAFWVQHFMYLSVYARTGCAVDMCLCRVITMWRNNWIVNASKYATSECMHRIVLHMARRNCRFRVFRINKLLFNLFRIIGAYGRPYYFVYVVYIYNVRTSFLNASFTRTFK